MEKNKSVLVRVVLLDRGSSEERHGMVERSLVLSKKKLVAAVFNEIYGQNILVDDDFMAQLVVQRKSKKHKGYVTLDSASDFDDMKRSLRVKSHVLLVVKSHVAGKRLSVPRGASGGAEQTPAPKYEEFDDPPVEDPPFDDPPVGEPNVFTNDGTAKPGPQLHFNGSNDTEFPYQEPIEQLKDAIHEFQNSGIWFGLRNLAATAATTAATTAAANHDYRRKRVQNLTEALNENAAAISHILNGTASTLASAINQNASLLAEAINKSCGAEPPRAPEPTDSAQPQNPPTSSGPEEWPFIPRQFCTGARARSFGSHHSHTDSQGWSMPSPGFCSGAQARAHASANPHAPLGFCPGFVPRQPMSGEPNPFIATPHSPSAAEPNPQAQKLPVVHEHVTCDTCYPDTEGEFIRGIRYKCLMCRNYDMCSACYHDEKNSTHTEMHPMMAIRKHKPLVFKGCYRTANFADKSLLSSIIEDNATFDKRTPLLEQLKSRGLNNFLDYCSDLIVKDLERRSNSNPTTSAVEEKTEATKPVVAEEKKETPEPIEASKTIVEQKSDVNEQAPTGHPVDIFLYPTGPQLAILRVTNKGSDVLDCDPLEFELSNFLGRSLTSKPLNIKRGIRPNRTVTFNIPISSAHFKHPCVVSLKSGTSTGRCDLKQGVFVGSIDLKSDQNVSSLENFVLDNEAKEEDSETRSTSNSEVLVEKNEETVDASAETTDDTEEVLTETVVPEQSSPDNEVEQARKVSGPVVASKVAELEALNTSPQESVRHSVVYPKLCTSVPSVQKLDQSTATEESLYFESRSRLSSAGSPQEEDSKLGLQVQSLNLADDDDDDDDAETEDYDMVSVSDADEETGSDFGSDYEVLSPVVSHEEK